MLVFPTTYLVQLAGGAGFKFQVDQNVFSVALKMLCKEIKVTSS